MIPAGAFRKRLLPLCFLCVGLLHAPLEAQDGGGGPAADLSHDVVAPRAQAVRTAQPIRIDGILDEEAWATAPVITGLIQLEPEEGAAASQRTEVRVVFDDQAIYVGAVLHDSGPVRSVLARRDGSMSESDVFAVLFDSRHDHETAYRFATNPSGMKHDQVVTSGRNDSSWDPVWDVAAALTDEGWSVEMRIPFSQLRFGTEEEQVWGIQIERRIHRNQERAVFSFTPLLESSGVHRFGHLDGLREIRSGQRLELLPYMTGRAERLQMAQPPDVGFSNPFRSDAEWFAGAGLDLKYRVSSNLTLDATVNPDFGQVEVDPAVINLTAFETRFQERRPFFVEGADAFRFGEGGPRGSVGSGPDVFYPRRIGRAPQGGVPSAAAFSDVPSSTAILGAAKLSGRTGGGWLVGVLGAATARESARYVDEAGILGRAVVEPAASYVVGRVRRDLRSGDTRLGGMLTAANRDIGDDALAARLHSGAYTAGMDLVHYWAGRRWRFNASYHLSHVTGDAEAITRTQRASARYFQRPDARHVAVDPDATSLTGSYWMGLVEKEAGTWTGRIGGGVVSPGYDVNDLGFQTAADRILFDTHLQYNQTTPGRWFRSWSAWGGPNGIWNRDGDYLLDNTNLNARWEWMNYWGGSARVSWSIPTYDDRATRGGPLMRQPAGWEANLSLNTDSRRSYTIRAQLRSSGDRGGSWNRSTSLNVNYKPRENWEFQIGPQLSRRREAAQYVATVTDDRAADTYGRRYVFGELDQTTLGLETRVNVTFTPALSLQLYAQPFLSSGAYEGLKELSAPRTFDFRVYGEGGSTIERQGDGFYQVDPDGSGDEPFLFRDPDFTLRSLRGNAVLRWEWRPGSTLYLVWQQHRSASLTGVDADPSIGGVELGGEAGELFGIRPDNIFAIKVTYWLNP